MLRCGSQSSALDYDPEQMNQQGQVICDHHHLLAHVAGVATAILSRTFDAALCGTALYGAAFFLAGGAGAVSSSSSTAFRLFELSCHIPGLVRSENAQDLRVAGL
jgi:hypothetical protein